VEEIVVFPVTFKVLRHLSMVQNSVGHGLEEVTGLWKIPYKLNDLYCSPNIVQVIKLRMRWAGQGM
jgi:hypothetical protein